MVNQDFRIKIAYRSKKKEEENTRDRSVPDGSDNEFARTPAIVSTIAYSCLGFRMVFNVLPSLIGQEAS